MRAHTWIVYTLFVLACSTTAAQSPANTPTESVQNLASSVSFYEDLNGELSLVDDLDRMPQSTREILRLLSTTNANAYRPITLIYSLSAEHDADRGFETDETLLAPSFKITLKDMDLRMMSAYIALRLRKSGYNGAGLFTLEALESIHESTRGNPRRVNDLAYSALLKAEELGATRISVEILEAIARCSIARRPIW